ncbi:MAG: hypothetical protein Q9222_006464 [Ikaeria aurantiellina]
MDTSTSTMAHSPSVSLRAWPQVDETKESLPFLIARINEQKGSFRAITEASLEAEIKAVEAEESQAGRNAEDSPAEEEGQDVQAKGDELAAAREEIIKQVGHGTKAAESTISPFLKEVVPGGSIGVDVMQSSQRSAAQETSDAVVNLGWRMQALTRSADSLLGSATRLNQDMEGEIAYWEEILTLKEEKWPLHRLPREKNTLGVQVGFADAYTDFRDRGLIALRNGSDGKVTLDRGSRWQGDKHLQIRVLKNGKLLAMNKQPIRPVEDGSTLTQRLVMARNSLFDEELYHELNREARNLVNQGVRFVDGCVCFPYEDGSQAEVRLVRMDDEEDLSQVDTAVPDALATILRLLLSQSHRQTFERRSQRPPAITNAPPVRPVYPLLRPIIEHTHHSSTMKTITGLLDHLKSTMSAAGLSFTAESTVLAASGRTGLLGLLSASLGPIAGSLAKPITQSHHSQMRLILPSKQSVFMLDVHTSILPPTFGSVLQLSTVSAIPGSALVDMPNSLRFPTVEKLQKHILYVATLDLIADLRSSLTLGPDWTQSFPFEAKLIRRNPQFREVEHMSISLEQQGLVLQWHIRGQSGRQIWSTTGSETENDVPNLINFIKGKIC